MQLAFVTRPLSVHFSTFSSRCRAISRWGRDCYRATRPFAAARRMPGILGPQDNARSVRELVETVIRFWGAGNWRHAVDATAAHEAGVLRLATDKAHALLQWKTRWGFDETMDRTVKWYRARTERAAGEGAIDMSRLCVRQINDYMRVHT